MTNKMVKAGDAEVPVQLWGNQLIDRMTSNPLFKMHCQLVDADPVFALKWTKATQLMRQP